MSERKLRFILEGSSKLADVGQVLVSYQSQVEGYLLCDGSAISREAYNDLFSVIGVQFGGEDGETTFNIPDFRGRFIQGALENDLGSVKLAGLPNIYGRLSKWNASITGGIYPPFQGNGSEGGSRYLQHSGDSPVQLVVYFNANLSNKIYGKSNTVQPPSISLNVFIKY